MHDAVIFAGQIHRGDPTAPIEEDHGGASRRGEGLSLKRTDDQIKKLEAPYVPHHPTKF